MQQLESFEPMKFKQHILNRISQLGKDKKFRTYVKKCIELNLQCIENSILSTQECERYLVSENQLIKDYNILWKECENIYNCKEILGSEKVYTDSLTLSDLEKLNYVNTNESLKAFSKFFMRVHLRHFHNLLIQKKLHSSFFIVNNKNFFYDFSLYDTIIPDA